MFAVDLLSEIQEPELVDGVRVRKVSPKRTHGIVQINLAMILRRCSPPGDVGSEWRCSVEEGISELVPDVSFVSHERLALLSQEGRELPPFAPDVAVEIRSEKDKQKVLNRKIELYLRHGCLLVLDVDPRKRRILAYERGGAVREFALGERLSSALVPWLDFEVGEAFVRLDD